MARPSGQDFPKHEGGLFENFGKISKISKTARRSGQDFPKHKGGLFGNFGSLEISEILEISEVRGENFGNFGIEFGRADRHPSDDRPCTTTQLRGHGLSTGGGGAIIYIYIYMHV